MGNKPPFLEYESFTSYEEYREELRREKLKSKKEDWGHPLRVSNHAVGRFADKSEIRGIVRGDLRKIIRELIEGSGNRMDFPNGITKVWIDEFSHFVIKNGSVVTFIKEETEKGEL